MGQRVAGGEDTKCRDGRTCITHARHICQQRPVQARDAALIDVNAWPSIMSIQPYEAKYGGKCVRETEKV